MTNVHCTGHVDFAPHTVKPKRKKQKVVCPKYPTRKRFETKTAAGAACARIANTQKEWRVPDPCSHCNGYHLAKTR